MVRLKRIVVDPKIMVGKPVIKSARVTVEAIIHRIAEGTPQGEILKDYPRIMRKDIKAAVDWTF